MMKSNNLFIGIDDTDSATSKGTGHFSRCLGHQIEKAGLGQIAGISRHQLLKDKSLDYTTSNNSTCVELVTNAETSVIIEFMRDFIRKNSAKDSEPGFCITSSQCINQKVIDFGIKVKKKIVTSDQAFLLASEYDIHIEGINKDSRGIIGALAAIGLRATGDDGTMIWVKGHEINDMTGVFHAGEIYCNTRVDCIKTSEGFRIPVNATIECIGITKPQLMENYVTIIVEEHPEKEICDWRVTEM